MFAFDNPAAAGGAAAFMTRPSSSQDAQAQPSEFVAVYDFAGENADELTVAAGTSLQVLEIQGQWLVACVVETGKEGLIPASYVAMMTREIGV